MVKVILSDSEYFCLDKSGSVHFDSNQEETEAVFKDDDDSPEAQKLRFKQCIEYFKIWYGPNRLLVADPWIKRVQSRGPDGDIIYTEPDDVAIQGSSGSAAAAASSNRGPTGAAKAEIESKDRLIGQKASAGTPATAKRPKKRGFM